MLCLDLEIGTSTCTSVLVSMEYQRAEQHYTAPTSLPTWYGGYVVEGCAWRKVVDVWSTEFQYQKASLFAMDAL